jgi:hypothetical protein
MPDVCIVLHTGSILLPPVQANLGFVCPLACGRLRLPSTGRVFKMVQTLVSYWHMVESEGVNLRAVHAYSLRMAWTVAGVGSYAKSDSKGIAV